MQKFHQKSARSLAIFNETIEIRERCIFLVFGDSIPKRLHYRGFFSAATFCAEVLGSELLLTGFFWSSFLGVVLARFFSLRAFRLGIPKRCKGVHCVDLGESFPTRIYLQKSASIQPRTSPSKFGGKIQFNIHFTPYACLRRRDHAQQVLHHRRADVVELHDA